MPHVRRSDYLSGARSMKPWPAFDAVTPLGMAEVRGIDAGGPDIIWLCVMVETGEIFAFRNQFVRVAWDMTSGNCRASKFTFKPEPALAGMIKRYIDNKWLPADWTERMFYCSGEPM